MVFIIIIINIILQNGVYFIAQQTNLKLGFIGQTNCDLELGYRL